MNSNLLAGRTAQTRFMLARAWHSKGTSAAAIAGYREVLALEPAHLQAAILLGALMQEYQRLDEAIEIYRHALQHHPNEAILHKQFVNVMLRQAGFEEVFRYYDLARADSKLVNIRPADPVCCVVLRNEIARLPY